MKRAWLTSHSTYTLSHSHSEWLVLLFTLWVRLSCLQPVVAMSHKGRHGNAVNVIWGAPCQFFPQQSVYPASTVQLPCDSLESWSLWLKSPDNICALWEYYSYILSMIPKSLSVIPHQGWNQIQVPLGEEWEERDYGGRSKESTYTTYLSSSLGLDLDFY